VKLTGTFVIEAGVLNRNESLTNVLSLKEIYTPKGLKVFFSDKAYKASLFSQGKFETTVSRAGGVVQKIGTVIENEELDFAGTMIAGKGDLDKVAYKRETAFAVSYGETIYPADTTIEFLTNGRLSELYGLNKTNPFSRKTVKNIYKLSFVIDLDRVGEQSFSIVKTSEMEDIEDIDKAEFLHKYFFRFYNFI
jgi:CRISPR-associated protein Cst2